MDEYLKKLIMPDMVSLWVPSGQNRAIDLIRGNHGQCSGTHPNVPVLPKLINPSVGWHFITNDYVNCGDDKSLFPTNEITHGAWIYPRDIITNQAFIGSRGVIDENSGVTMKVNNNELFMSVYIDGVGWTTSNKLTPILNAWQCVVGTFDGSEVYCYKNAETGTPTSQVGTISQSNEGLYLGCQGSDRSYPFDGYSCLSFVANKAWSVAQISNFYNATKGMFAPRG